MTMNCRIVVHIYELSGQIVILTLSEWMLLILAIMMFGAPTFDEILLFVSRQGDQRLLSQPLDSFLSSCEVRLFNRHGWEEKLGWLLIVLLLLMIYILLSLIFIAAFLGCAYVY